MGRIGIIWKSDSLKVEKPTFSHGKVGFRGLSPLVLLSGISDDHSAAACADQSYFLVVIHNHKV
jgi:hypothetical protein